MKEKIKVSRRILLGFSVMVLMCLGLVKSASATLLTVSPPNQKISLVPGQKTKTTLSISSPASNTKARKYKITVSPFKVDDTGNSAVFENNGDYNRLVDWITLDWEEGVLEPNEVVEVGITIDTPKNAPAGGQYAALMVASVNDGEEEGSINIKNTFQIGHLIYADVAGTTKRGGDISNVSLPSFLFSGKVTASATITNQGNVHSDAIHVLKVFPLFSNEELYTNEETPEQTLVMPEATRYTSVSWDNTPSIGIFKVQYLVNFEGIEKEVNKTVIVCPLWLLFIILLIVAVLVFKFVLGKKTKKVAHASVE